MPWASLCTGRGKGGREEGERGRWEREGRRLEGREDEGGGGKVGHRREKGGGERKKVGWNRGDRPPILAQRRHSPPVLFPQPSQQLMLEATSLTPPPYPAYPRHSRRRGVGS